MKIKVKKLPYTKVLEIEKPEHVKPRKSPLFLRFLMKTLGKSDLKQTDFSYTLCGMDKIPDEPCLILMNHSSFIDLEIMSTVFYKHPFAIVCTSDGFVGKEWLMRKLGCIPTNKFVSDHRLISDMAYALKNEKINVLMYPEASYSFDGRNSTIPEKLGTLLKLLKVPVIMVTTFGAYHRDPLYNCLQKRSVKVSAEIKMLATLDDVKSKSVEELDEKIKDAFSLDYFSWQKENGVKINEPFRADGLERILFRCASCNTEGGMTGKGDEIVCSNCKKRYSLLDDGTLKAESGETEFSHIPSWYDWEKSEVKKQIEGGEYSLDIPVNIKVLADFKAVYDIGNGRLTHDINGFTLKSDDGALDYFHPAISSYSVYADYFWYELGDVICIGNNDRLYYCFPDKGVSVAKVRIAAEEIYKLARDKKRTK